MKKANQGFIDLVAECRIRKPLEALALAIIFYGCYAAVYFLLSVFVIGLVGILLKVSLSTILLLSTALTAYEICLLLVDLFKASN